jgi:hypothetical protein
MSDLERFASVPQAPQQVPAVAVVEIARSESGRGEENVLCSPKICRKMQKIKIFWDANGSFVCTFSLHMYVGNM